MRGSHDISVQLVVQWVLAASQRRPCGAAPSSRLRPWWANSVLNHRRESGSLTRRRAARTATRSAPVRARRSSGVPRPRRRPHHLDVLHMRPDGVRASAQHSMLVTRQAGGRPHLQRRVVVVATSRPSSCLGGEPSSRCSRIGLPSFPGIALSAGSWRLVAFLALVGDPEGNPVVSRQPQPRAPVNHTSSPGASLLT